MELRASATLLRLIDPPINLWAALCFMILLQEPTWGALILSSGSTFIYPRQPIWITELTREILDNSEMHSKGDEIGQRGSQNYGPDKIGW